MPTLILQSEANPVVDPKGSQRLFFQIRSSDKEFCLLSGARHTMVSGEGSEEIFLKIANFLKRL